MMDSGHVSLPNGAPAPPADGLSPAQRLMAQDDAVESHKPTVEEVVDEEDIAHPPPSSHSGINGNAASAVNGQPLSDKAAGKQRAQAEPSDNVSNKKAQSVPPDTMSEEAFPSLGGARSLNPLTPVTWSMKTASPKNVNAKEGTAATNGLSNPPSNLPSGASTPKSGVQAPALMTPLQMPLQQRINLPGRKTDEFTAPIRLLKSNKDLKKPIPEILRDFNRRSKAKVNVAYGDGKVIFTGSGPTKEAAQQAIKDVVSQLCIKQSETIAVPVSVRPHIIGRQGTIINGISKRTGARVQMPNKTQSGALDSDDGADINVELEGDPIAVAYARNEIQAIIDERQAAASFRLREIPAEYFPHIAGPHNVYLSSLEEGRNVRIQIPHYHTWDSQQPLQVPASGEKLTFAPHPAHSIHISGDRQAALEARAAIERRYEELRQTLSTKQVPIERGRHQFIVGDRGGSLHDFLKDTGCSVILPPALEDTEIITIVGPSEKMDLAISNIENLAYGMLSSSVDIARQHQSAPLGAQEHARFITQYLRQKNAIQELERQHSASISIPMTAGNRTDWDIYSKDNKNLSRARTDILNLVNGHPPSRLQPVKIHPFYQDQLQRQYAHIIRDQYGVHTVFPEDPEESQHILLVYEGTVPAAEYQLPRKQPTQTEVAEFARALEQAQNYILNLIGNENEAEIVQHELQIPSKFREKVKRFAARESQAAPSTKIFPVQIIDHDSVQQNGNTKSSDTYYLKIRGTAPVVEDFNNKYQAFIDEQIRDEAERGYTTSADFPQKFVNVLIGRRGENINKLRDEYDVDFQVEDGKVEIKGPKAKADAARAHIIALGKKLEDETTHILKVHQKYHRDLIGAKGAQVHRLQDRYSVRINFPRTSSSPAEGQSIADGVSDAGTAPRGPRSSQASDEIIIKGPKKGADEARNEVLDLYQYLMDHSHSATVSVAQSQLPSLIGQGGQQLESMRLQTGAKIDIPGSKETVDPSGRVDVKVKGTKAQVDAAKKLLESRAKIFDNSITQNLDIDKKHHQGLIGRGGENIRKLIIDAGATADDPRELARYVQFPKAGTDNTTIVVEGDKKIVEKIIASIQAHVSQRENQVTETLEIPPERHGALIGRGGSVRKQLESDFNIILNIPSQTTTGAARSAVKVTGLPTDVANAKEKITSMLKSQQGETIIIPCRLHHVIAESDNGNFFRNLSRNLKVTIDHAGQSRPTRPLAPQAPPALITSDPETDWQVLEPKALGAEGEVDPTIPWILKGPDAENIAKAKALVLAALASADQSCTGFLTLSDPKDNRHVIGQAGNTVNRIRKETKCHINVPKAGSDSDAIEIRGSRDAIEQAKEMILEAIDDATKHAKKQ